MSAPRHIGLSLHAAAGLLAVALAPGAVGLTAALSLPAVAFSPWLPPLRGVIALPVLLGGWGLYALAPDHAALLTLIGLLVHQRLGPLADRRDEWVVLISALLVVAGTVRVDHPVFIGAWLAWTATLPAALSPGWSPRTALSLLGASLLMFVLLPRPAPPGVGRGLSDTVELGRYVPDDPDEEVLASLSTPVPTDRLRASAFVHFDGRRWTRRAAAPAAWSPAAAGEPGGERAPFHTRQQALDRVLLTPGLVVGLDASGGVTIDDDGTLWGDRTGLDGVWAPAAPLPATGPADPDLLQVPPDLLPALAPLTANLPAAPRARAAALAERIHDRHIYDASGVARPGLEDFLSGSRRGDCAHFASATVLAARATGLPARLVTGLAGGEREGDELVLRARDAHAWAELHVEGEGWVVVDATRAAPPRAALATIPEVPVAPPPLVAAPPPPPPPGWAPLYERLLSFDAADQRALLARLAPWVLLAAAALALRGVWRRRPSREPPPLPRDGVAGQLDRALDGLRRRGWSLPPHMPPLEAARQVAEVHGERARALEELAWLYYEVSFGGAEAGPRLERAEQLAREVEGLGGPG